VRAGILALLAEQPRNGYQIMQELEQRSRGAWRPSPGSVYPALQQLEDEGLVHEAQTAAGRVYELTEKGREHVKAHEAEIGSPWEAKGGGVDTNVDLIVEMRSLAAAVFQLTHHGSATQIAEAKKLLQQTRRALYRLLGEDGE
jgi:DNA-binding PadR family transcriptional regulator